MKPNVDPVERIRKLRQPGLKRLWKRIQQGKTPGWDSGKAFEHLILRAFELEGAKVRYPFSVIVGQKASEDEPDSRTDEQIDGVIYIDGLHCLVEFKDWSKPVNIDPIAKLRNQLLRRPSIVIGCLFSRSGFTDSAKTLAQYLAPQTILLWNGDDIEYALERQAFRRALIAKLRYTIEHAVSDVDVASLLEDFS
jgi:hypothetical protein